MIIPDGSVLSAAMRMNLKKGSGAASVSIMLFPVQLPWQKTLEIENFTTTLTISPHKISKIIFEKGSQYPGFLPYDFKKKEGFKRSIELSREYDLYRQGYCGCEFSMR